ncbi:MAG: ABC transporter permease [Tannerella sp.]|nr:ABC transporter permease [Tannerella sp.]
MILRSWWRNKTFAFISIISMSVGLACTTLLLAFVICEYNVEAGNPNRNRIVYMSQDSPMQSGETVSWIRENVPPMLKENYAEVEDFLRFKTESVRSVIVDGDQYHAPFMMTGVDASFPEFFPYRIIAGNLNEALTEPRKLAITEKTAKRIFGNENPVGKNIVVEVDGDDFEGNQATKESYTVVALLQEREQSFLHVEALTMYTEGDHGGVSMLLVNGAADMSGFSKKIKRDGVPTLQEDIGRYYFSSLQESYFKEYVQEYIPFIVRRQAALLYLGFGSAILILLIACINYINLNFSRFLQQARIIHVQRLMGASNMKIIAQLFLDTLLTVSIAFLISLLIAGEVLPLFNTYMSAGLKASFFFDRQVLPVLLCLVVLLSAVPACYMGRKIMSVPVSEYRHFFTGKKKQHLIAVLSVVQYAISVALIIAAITVNRQVGLIYKGGEIYKGLIEIGNEDASAIRSLTEELRKYPDLQMTRAKGSLLYSWLKQIILKDNDGNETYYRMLIYSGETSFLNTLQINLIQGLPPEQAVNHYAYPVYVNRKFADILVPAGENPIGKPLKLYDKDFLEDNTTIAGVIDNMYTNSLENEAYPITVHINGPKEENYSYLYIRSGEKQIGLIQKEWEKTNPNKYFAYQDVYQEFLSRNNKAVELSRILWMYSIISLFLTCFGLYGMSLYTIRQRTKEIALRKVNGATTGQIILLLIRRFFGWIAIAFITALPVSLILLNNWLSHYAYRTSISFTVCLLSLLLILAITLLTIIRHSYKAATEDPVKVLKTE